MMISACNKCGEQYPSASAGHIHKCGKCSGGMCSPLQVDTEALIAAVRAGDIEAAQALLPVDPIVKRAREICARHMGSPSRWLSGEMDGQSMMGAVMEALSTPEVDAAALTRMARAACYVAYQSPDYLSAHSSTRPNVERMRDALDTALVGNHPVVTAISA